MRKLKIKIPEKEFTEEKREKFLLENFDSIIKSLNKLKRTIDGVIILTYMYTYNNETQYEEKWGVDFRPTSDRKKILRYICEVFTPVISDDVELLITMNENRLDEK